MFNFRFILGFAALAVVISLFAGLLGGIPFGLILIRTIIGAAVFALLGAGAWWILQRFIPELLNAEARGTPVQARESGDEVDIVIPEENPHAQQKPSGVSEPFSADQGFERLEPQAGRAAESEGGDSELEFEPEIAGAALENGMGDVDKGPIGESGPTEEELSDEPAAWAAETEAQPAPEDIQEEFADLDSMPSLDSIEGAFAQSNTEQNAPQSDATIDVMGQQQDAATTAKAIKTWLKRDEKG